MSRVYDPVQRRGAEQIFDRGIIVSCTVSKTRSKQYAYYEIRDSTATRPVAENCDFGVVETRRMRVEISDICLKNCHNMTAVECETFWLLHRYSNYGVQISSINPIDFCSYHSR